MCLLFDLQAMQSSGATLSILLNFTQVYVLLLDPFAPILAPEISGMFSLGGGGLPALLSCPFSFAAAAPDAIVCACAGTNEGMFSSICLGPMVSLTQLLNQLLMLVAGSSAQDFNGRSLLKFFVPILALLALFAICLIEALIRKQKGWKKPDVERSVQWVMCSVCLHRLPLTCILWMPCVRMRSYLRTAVALGLAGHSTWTQIGLQGLPSSTSCLSAGPHGSFLVAAPDLPCEVSSSRAASLCLV